MNIKTRLAVSTIITGVLALTIGVSFIMTSRVVAREEEESRNVRNLLKDLFELELVAQNYLAHRLDRAEKQWQLKHASISRQLEIMVLSHQDEENIL